MRLNIDIDDDLMREALSVTRFKTRREVIEEGLELLIRKSQEKMLDLKGTLRKEDLENLRRDESGILS